jgi:thioredoxin-like negative regulator of GroEL
MDDLVSMHTSRRRPLIALFTASWCRTCHEISPIVRGLIEDEYVGLDEGGVGFAEVQIDSPLAEDLGTKYAIGSVPTLLAFSKGQMRVSTRETDASRMRDRKWLKEWIENESRNGGNGDSTGGFGFGNWFGGGKI